MYSLSKVVTPGHYYTLTVISVEEIGAYLDAGRNMGKLLLPKRYMPEDIAVDDELEVFVYLDSEDRPIATTLRPKTQVGEVSRLKVAQVNNAGAFLEWGLPKDLLLPFSEQKHSLQEGDTAIVFTYRDPHTNRIVASTRLNRFIKDESVGLKQKDKVHLMIIGRTDLGYKVVVNHSFWGLIHSSDIHQAIRAGQKMTGYVKRVRDDNKLDISLEQAGYGRVDPLSDKILKKLKDQNGFLALSDKSPADLIEMHFGVSKRAYKMAIGKLYKQRIIKIEPDGIYLVKK